MSWESAWMSDAHTLAPQADARPPADVLQKGCMSRRVLESLADKWSLLVIHTLSIGPGRTAELRRRIGGISEKMLIQTLRRLERNGFVVRRSFNEVPPRVEYSLTVLGASLSEPIRAFDAWVERNMAAVSEAQRAFDGKG
jgi:DNA-binding HxlR family transcriptional regulator